MKENKIKNLIEKYEAGASTLSDEKILFDNAENSKPTIEAWSTFVKRNKKEAPQNFNDILWESFQNRKIKKHRLLVGIMSAAASVLLIIFLFIGHTGQKKLSYNEKAAFLNEALNMFSGTEQVQTQESIIYENEFIIIYTSSE